MCAAPRYGPEEAALITRLFAEGHSTRSVSVLTGRTKLALENFRRDRGLPSYRLGDKRGRTFRIILSHDAYGTLAACAAELETGVPRLARVLLEICAAKKYYGAILDLGGYHAGPDRIETESGETGSAAEDSQAPAVSLGADHGGPQARHANGNGHDEKSV